MNIPANSTEAHTIAIHSLINDMREVLDLCAMAWTIVALTLGIGAVMSLLDGSWIRATFQVALTGFALWSARDFHKRGRKYPTRKRRTSAAEVAEEDA